MAGARRTPLAAHRPAARLARPLREFLSIEASGGIVLLAAVIVAMIWANSPWSGSYEDFWHTELGITIGSFELREDLRHWVNDALMVLFFFVIGLEVKREIVVGELSQLRAAIVPTLAAVGGMVVPASIYLAINAGGATQGWGVPVATDIAFAIGVLVLIGSRVPSNLRILLLTLAIVDDIGAILVIAIFYSSGISTVALLAAAGGIALIVLLRALHVWWVPAYVIVGTGVWLAVFESGIHATIAGVVLGLLAPARPLHRDELDHERLAADFSDGLEPERAQEACERLIIAVPVTDRLAHALHPWTSNVILPLFALANAGIAIAPDEIGDALTSPVALGIIVGLVAGKIVGVSAFAWLARRLGASLPAGVTMGHVVGMAALAGIGFTMSLFIGTLAFELPALIDQAKLGILAASVMAAAIGVAVLLTRPPTARPIEASSGAETGT